MDLKKIRELLMKDFSEWTYKDCVEVDQVVKESALSNLEGKLKAQDVPDNIIDFVIDMSKYSYGSVQVDEFLMKMEAYDMNLIHDNFADLVSQDVSTIKIVKGPVL